jgi:hypothetical protein
VAVNPLSVQIVSDSDWWLPWLPVLGSVLVAAAALGGVLASNRRADAREFAKWRRETILKLSSDAATAALGISREFQDLTTREHRDYDEDAKETIGRFKTAIRRLPEIEAHLQLVGATELASKCRLIGGAMRMALDPGFEYIEARSSGADGPTVLAAEMVYTAAIGVIDTSREALVAEAQRELRPNSTRAR